MADESLSVPLSFTVDVFDDGYYVRGTLFLNGYVVTELETYVRENASPEQKKEAVEEAASSWIAQRLKGDFSR